MGASGVPLQECSGTDEAARRLPKVGKIAIHPRPTLAPQPDP